MSIYSPQDPVNPEYFAGRNEVLKKLKKIMTDSVLGKAENAEIHGLRGIGKTSLVNKLIGEAPEKCFTLYYAAEEEDEKSFVDNILQKMDIEYKNNLTKYRKVLERLRNFPEKINELSVAEISIALKRDEKTPKIAFAEGILKLRSRGFSSCYLFIDEADALTDKTLQMIRNVIQEIRNVQRFPVGVVVSGKQDLLKRLTDKLSPIARFFATVGYELPPLSEVETRDALTLPVKTLSVTWDEEAISFVYEKSRGYPFVVQLYGKFALELVRSAHIKEKDMAAVHASVVKEMGAMYENEWKKEPSETELKVLVRLAKTGTPIKYTNIKVAGKMVSGVILRRLIEKGCLSQDETRDEYYFAHPLIQEYLLGKN